MKRSRIFAVAALAATACVPRREPPAPSPLPPAPAPPPAERPAAPPPAPLDWQDAPLSPGDVSTFYSGDAKGYVDYPALDQAEAA